MYKQTKKKKGQYTKVCMDRNTETKLQQSHQNAAATQNQTQNGASK